MNGTCRRSARPAAIEVLPEAGGPLTTSRIGGSRAVLIDALCPRAAPPKTGCGGAQASCERLCVHGSRRVDLEHRAGERERLVRSVLESPDNLVGARGVEVAGVPARTVGE